MSHVSKQGRKALEKVAEWLEAGAPHRVLDHGLAVTTFDMGLPVEVDDHCGTSCCIAGAVCQFEGLGLDVRDPDGSLEWFGENGAMDLAGPFLGMGLIDQVKLFEPWNHSLGDSESFNAPARGAAVIRYFLATGIVSWDRFDEDGSPRSAEEIQELVRLAQADAW